MTNQEFIKMIEKMHKVENNAKWKVHSVLVGIGFAGIIYALWISGQNKSKIISSQQAEIQVERQANLQLSFLNNQLKSDRAAQDIIIENISRENKLLMNRISQSNEKKQEA